MNENKNSSSFTINNHRFLCVCVSVPHASAPLTGPIFMIFLHLDREFTGDDARFFHFSFGALWSPVLRQGSEGRSLLAHKT